MKTVDTSVDTSLEGQVKIAILNTFGENYPDPTTLDDDKSMSDFNFNDIQYIHLVGEFNEIAKKNNEKSKEISIGDVEKCDKVKDCKDLVTQSSKI